MTDEINEEGEEKAKPKTAKKKTTAKKDPETVWFESREPEPTMFSVAGYASIRNFGTNRLEWEVKFDDLERFMQNHFVKMSRVVKKRDE
ncbi:MAG: hypothetical protein EBV86_03185 [Marivivens sp.]|nr:hypothetical protein [Marivivens sp.]